MAESNVEKYLMEGIHGKKELNIEEKRKFLGALRERIIFALTKKQVRKNSIPNEIQMAIKEYSKAKMLLNGHIDYSYLSKYIKLCEELNVPYTLVTDQEHDTDIGLVLVNPDAIDKEHIYLDDKKPKFELKEKNKKKGLFSFFSKS